LGGLFDENSLVRKSYTFLSDRDRPKRSSSIGRGKSQKKEGGEGKKIALEKRSEECFNLRLRSAQYLRKV